MPVLATNAALQHPALFGFVPHLTTLPLQTASRKSLTYRDPVRAKPCDRCSNDPLSYCTVSCSCSCCDYANRLPGDLPHLKCVLVAVHGPGGRLALSSCPGKHTVARDGTCYARDVGRDLEFLRDNHGVEVRGGGGTPGGCGSDMGRRTSVVDRGRAHHPQLRFTKLCFFGSWSYGASQQCGWRAQRVLQCLK